MFKSRKRENVKTYPAFFAYITYFLVPSHRNHVFFFKELHTISNAISMKSYN